MREGSSRVTTPLAPRAGSCLATSAFTIRPPGPDPVSARRSTCDSRAIRRASGDAFTRPAPLSVSGDLPAAAGAGAARRGRAGAGGPDRGSDASPIVAITPPSGTVSPSPATIRSVPSASASNVTVALSVSTSAIGSPFDTTSPSLLQPADDRALLHRVRQPRHHELWHVIAHRDSGALADARGDRRRARDERVLERRAVRDRQLVGGEQPRVVEVVEAVLGDLPEQARTPSRRSAGPPRPRARDWCEPPTRARCRRRAGAACAGRRPPRPRPLRPVARRPRARRARPCPRTRSSRRRPTVRPERGPAG